MGYLDNKGLEKYTWNVRNRVAKNEQMTKVKPLVSFCPAPETDLEPIVNFAVKETMPAEGAKGPDNPSTIAGVSEIKLSRCGKNLFPLSKAPKYNNSQTINDVVFTMNEDGWITCNGTASARTSYFFVVSGMRIKIPAGTYTISGMPDASYGQSVGLNICTYLSFNPDTGFWNTATDIGNGATFTTTEARYMVVGIAVAAGVKLENYIIKPQLEVGSKATPFEPYKGNDFSFSLNGTYYGGSVNLASGEMIVSYKGIVFDGTEDWSGPDDHGGGCYSFGLSINSYGTSFPYSSPNAHLLSSHFDYIANTSLQSNHFYVPGQGGFLAVYTMFCTTLQDWKDWLASQSQNGTPLVVAYRLETSQTIQLDPIQVKSLASSDKYNHPVNYVYSNQESVQVGWTREDVVHKTGNEVIEDVKTFSNTGPTPVNGASVTSLIVRNPEVERGIPLETGNSYTNLIFSDANGDVNQTYEGRLGIIELKSPKNNETESLNVGCYKYNTSNKLTASNIQIGYDKNEIAYATAPLTSNERTNANDIATRKWVDDTEWNWQKSLAKPIVQFSPVPESIIEPKVNFLFTEILPSEGNKSPTNPSTIEGVDSVKVIRCGKNLIPNSNYPATTNGNGIWTTNSDGTVTAVATNLANETWFAIKNLEDDNFLYPGTYVMSGCEGGSSTTYQFNLATKKTDGTITYYTCTTKPVSFTITETVQYNANLHINQGATVNYTFHPQLEFASEASEYEKIERNEYTITLDNTYYGGYIDLNSGIMTVTWEAIPASGALSFYWSDTTSLSNTAILRATLPHFHTLNSICNQFPVMSTAQDSTDSEHYRLYGPSGTSGAIQFWINKSRFPNLSASDDGVLWRTAATNWLANNNVIVAYELATPYNIQLTPTQIHSLSALDKYKHRINTVYTDQKAVQVGYQRYVGEDNLVHKTGDEVISGTKTFTSSKTFQPEESSIFSQITEVLISNPTISKGIITTDRNQYTQLVFTDSSQDRESGRVCSIYYKHPSDYDSKPIATFAVDYIDNDNVSKRSRIAIGYDNINNVNFALAPSTSLLRDNSDDILTRDWIPKDTRIVHTTGNEDIAGYKTFTNSNINIKHLTAEKGKVVESTSYIQLGFVDKNNLAIGRILARGGEDGRTTIGMFCYDPTSSADTPNSQLAIWWLKNEDPYAVAPSTPLGKTGNVIVTHDYIPKDTRIVHTTGNERISGSKNFIETYISITNEGMKINAVPINSLFQMLAFRDADTKLVGRMLLYHNGSSNSNSHRGLILELSKKASSEDSVFIIGGDLDPSTNNYVVNIGGTGCTAFYPRVAGITLGSNSTSYRWGQIYSSSTSIQTSDERTKCNVSIVPNEILDAWADVNWVQFKMVDAVEKKGSSARLHNGMIAQHIDTIFKNHNLDIADYGLFCYDEWEKEEPTFDDNNNEIYHGQEAGNLYSLRYEEALCMEAAYMRRENMLLKKRIADLEERLAAIESRIA